MSCSTCGGEKRIEQMSHVKGFKDPSMEPPPTVSWVDCPDCTDRSAAFTDPFQDTGAPLSDLVHRPSPVKDEPKVRRYAANVWLSMTPDGVALADPELRTVVLATDYDAEIARLVAQIEEWRGKLAEQCGLTLAARQQLEAARLNERRVINTLRDPPEGDSSTWVLAWLVQKDAPSVWVQRSAKVVRDHCVTYPYWMEWPAAIAARGEGE